MNHPYREPQQLDSVLGEHSGAGGGSCGERRVALATLRRRPSWRLLAIRLVVGVSGTALACACARTTSRLIAASEQLHEAVMAMSAAANAANAAYSAPPPACVPAASPIPAAPDWPVALGLFRLDETTFVVERRVLDALLEHEAEGRLTNVVSESESGRTVGLVLFGIRTDSLLGRLGFKTGDRLQSINGIDVTSPEKALEAYARLRTSDDFSVVVTRGGSRVRLEYHLV